MGVETSRARKVRRNRMSQGQTFGALKATGCGATKYLRWKYSATLTSPISTGTSTSGPMTAANAAPELMPKTATATAMASSKLLLAAVKESVAVFE